PGRREEGQAVHDTRRASVRRAYGWFALRAPFQTNHGAGGVVYLLATPRSSLNLPTFLRCLMRDEPAFLQAVLANPPHDHLLLVYADWLEELAEPVAAAKAEFLRLTVLLATEPEETGPTDPQRQLTKSGRRSAKAKATARKRQTKLRRQRLQQLAADL